MILIVLVIHALIALALVGAVLLQRSEGGALGMGGGGGGGGGIMSGRSAGNVLTKSTAVLGGAFMATSILLALLAGRDGGAGSFLDEPAPAAQTEEAPPEEPTGPAVPLDR